MLKKWFNKLISSGKSAPPKACERVCHYAEHKIARSQLSFAAEKVIKRLQEKGFKAYVVGGAVRDLLLGLEPKDFDVATDASPEDVRKLFRRSRIIGRRFQIVHVMVGPETIEVTTFRGGNSTSQNEHGRIMKDNSFGSQAEDASRRDFTCNALYYDPATQTIVDYYQGIADVKAKQLVMIGQATERFQEDPVRILRAIRLCAKLGFTLEKRTQQAISGCTHLLSKEPPARLFDELLKLLLCGYARKCIQSLQEYNLAAAEVFPLLKFVLGEHQDNPFAQLILKNTDERLQNNKHVSIGFILAALLWQPVYLIWQKNIQQGQKSVPGLIGAMNEVQDSLDKRFAVPKRFSSMMREIWMLQPQFEARTGSRPFRLLAQARFRAGYDFMLVRVQVGELPQELADWWTLFQTVNDEEKKQMISQVKQPIRKTGGRRRVYRKKVAHVS